MTLSLRAFFEDEAADSLRELRAASAGTPLDVGRLRRSTRVLRGSARLAGDQRVFEVAAALAAGIESGGSAPDADFQARLSQTIDDIAALIAATDVDTGLDARARAAGSRWGGPPPATAAAPDRDADGFIVREAAGIADALDAAVTAFQADPHDHAWLGTLLKRQAALCGSVQLDSTPVLAESLEAVGDLIALIARLDVPVKAEWLDIFRSAREVLRSAHPLLERGEQPGPTPALSRLRTLRDELLSRYAHREPEPAIELEGPRS